MQWLNRGSIPLASSKLNIMKRYNLIEDDMIHTSDLSYEWAIEMEERYTKTFPNSEYWIEPIEYRN